MSAEGPASEQKRFGTGMFVLAWLAFMGLLGAWFNETLEQQHNPNQDLQTRLASDGVREVRLQRNRAGHYVTDGEINGHKVVFMLDTGATGVAIPAQLARKLAIPRGQAYQTQTANGMSVAYATVLASVSVGDISLQQVSAGITPGLQTNEVLLGMSFLKHIEFSQRGDSMLLRQYPN
ncbi:MAG: TIGR02281 family clan AA aspartic protease [Halieaceae bacterium]